MTRDEDIVDDLVTILSDPTRAIPPNELGRHTPGADQPGLYAWWADEEGVAALSTPFGSPLPSLIYAGQAGATSTRSHTERGSTLLSRIRGNHLGGNIRSSTFRKTLTAVLRNSLGLRLTGPLKLDADSNEEVSKWIRTHLRVGIAPVDDRATLAIVEASVLQRLDPPLNLMGMVPTATRLKLRQLRAELTML